MKTQKLFSALEVNGFEPKIVSVFDYAYNKDYSRLGVQVDLDADITQDKILLLSKISADSGIIGLLQTSAVGQELTPSIYFYDDAIVQQDGVNYDNPIEGSLTWNEFIDLKTR